VLIDKFLIYIAAAVLAATLGFAISWKIELWNVERKLSKCSIELELAQNNIKLQNTAIANWKTNAEAAAELAAKALADAEAKTKANRPAIDNLQTKILANKDSCTSAVAEIRKGLFK
jgi:hypothetical protein